MSSREVYVGNFKPSSKIGKYFSFWELTKSDTADAHNIDNIPTYQHISNAQYLAIHVLDKVREKFGVTNVNSWFRCEELERKIAERGYLNWLAKRGLPDSFANWRKYFGNKQHPKGEAADIECNSVSNRELYEWIRDNCEYDQLILENVTNPNDPRSGWVHVSCKASGNRKQAFEI